MLTLDREETSTPDYSIVNASIKETFAALDRFEWQAVAELQKMRDSELYRDAGYSSFREYCQAELSAWGGFRRINQLLGAKRVIDAVGEFGQHITNERKARPLLRLLKEPEKLREAVEIAISENPSPSEADFALAAQKVVPRQLRRKPPVQEPLVPKNNIVKITSPSHPRSGESGTIEADPPNPTQQIVTFADGEKLLVNNADLDIPTSPPQRTYPREYAEAIAQIKQQHQQELERLEQELRIRLVSEAKALAEQQLKEQLISSQQLYQQQKEKVIQLQQRLDEMEALRQFEYENQQLKQRIQELENSAQQRPSQEWGNTFTKQATKVLNKEVKRSLDNTIDLRSLAVEPPKENAEECLRLMGIALSNLGTAMNNVQALQAAALILGSEPNPTAIAHRAEQLQLLPQAVSDLRAVLSKAGCTWQDYQAVAQQYEVIKNDYLAELTPEEIELIAALEQTSSSKNSEPLVNNEAQGEDGSPSSFKTHSPLVLNSTPDDSGSSSNFTCGEPLVPNSTPTNSNSLNCSLITVGSIVAHADIYCSLYNAKGEVIEDMGDEVWVAWDHWKDQPKKTDRYFKNELRLI